MLFAHALIPRFPGHSGWGAVASPGGARGAACAGAGCVSGRRGHPLRGFDPDKHTQTPARGPPSQSSRRASLPSPSSCPLAFPTPLLPFPTPSPPRSPSPPPRLSARPPAPRTAPPNRPEATAPARGFRLTLRHTPCPWRAPRPDPPHPPTPPAHAPTPPARAHNRPLAPPTAPWGPRAASPPPASRPRATPRLLDPLPGSARGGGRVLTRAQVAKQRQSPGPGRAGSPPAGATAHTTGGRAGAGGAVCVGGGGGGGRRGGTRHTHTHLS